MQLSWRVSRHLWGSKSQLMEKFNLWEDVMTNKDIMHVVWFWLNKLLQWIKGKFISALTNWCKIANCLIQMWWRSSLLFISQRGLRIRSRASSCGKGTSRLFWRNKQFLSFKNRSFSKVSTFSKIAYFLKWYSSRLLEYSPIPFHNIHYLTLTWATTVF